MKFEYAFCNPCPTLPRPKCPIRTSITMTLPVKSFPIPSIAHVWAGSIRIYFVLFPVGTLRKGLRVPSCLKGLGFVSVASSNLQAPLTSYHSLAQVASEVGEPWEFQGATSFDDLGWLEHVSNLLSNNLNFAQILSTHICGIWLYSCSLNSGCKPNVKKANRLYIQWKWIESGASGLSIQPWQLETEQTEINPWLH